MDVTPLAAESLGVRSMATLVESGSVRLLIDPGVSLAPSRYGLPPTSEERALYEAAVARIIGVLCQVDAVVVTSYHEEHINLLSYVLSSSAIYLKKPEEPGERRQARDLLHRLERTGRAFECVTGKTVQWRDLSLSFSPALSEGRTGEGVAMAAAVKDNDCCFIHGSDAHGPLSPRALEWMLAQSPDLVYLSGPPTYRIGFEDAPLTAGDLQTCRTHLSCLQRETGCHVILDHMLLRDPAPRRWYSDLFESGQVDTAAGFLGLPDRPLEARRRETGRLGVALLPALSVADARGKAAPLAAAG